MRHDVCNWRQGAISLPPFFSEVYYGYRKSVRKIICYRLQRSSGSQKIRQYGTEICKLGVCLGRGEEAVPYTYTTPKWEYNPQTRRREKIGVEERTVEAASMFDVNEAIMQAAEFAATHEGMCADCYKATRLNVA